MALRRCGLQVGGVHELGCSAIECVISGSLLVHETEQASHIAPVVVIGMVFGSRTTINIEPSFLQLYAEGELAII